MRKWVPLLLAITLVPALAASVRAQVPPGLERGKPPKMEARTVTTEQARSLALARVGRDLQARSIEGWNGRSPAGLTVVSASRTNLGGRAAYIVAVQMMKSTGSVRVTLDAKTGEVLESRATTWDWGNAPAWYRAGANSPPPGQTR